MDREQLDNTFEEEYNNNNVESFQEHKNGEKSESLFGLTRGKTCENCKYFEALTSRGQSVRRCQACARKKNSFEKLPSYEEIGKEDRFETDCDLRDDSVAIPTSKFVNKINTKLEENSNDCIKDSQSENFIVEHEHVDLQGVNVAKVQNLTYNEEGKVVSRKKDNVLLNRKEYKSLNPSDSLSRKEKTFPKGSYLLDRDNTMGNEKIEQIIETLDAQKTKEEIELEKRERGWNVNHSKASTDGYALRKEQRDRIKIKLKSLREKPDTQRILGLVAKRSESRLSSPTHRVPNPNYKNNEEVPSITQLEINAYSSKLQEPNHEITSSETNSNLDESKSKSLYTDIQEVSKSKFHKSQEDSKSKCSLPTNLGYYSNESLHFGTQRILEILAKRNGNRVTSPSQNIEINTFESESNNIVYSEPRNQTKPKESNDTIQSFKSYNQQQENVLGLSKTTTNAYKEHDLIYQTKNEKELDLNCRISSNAHRAQQVLKYDNISLANASCHSNDSQFYNMDHNLELIAQKGENSILSPQKCNYYNSRDKSLSNLNGNQPNIVEVQNEIVTSCSKEDQKDSPSKISQSTSILHSHDIIHKRNEETKYEEAFLRPNSSGLKFSTPSNTICHINDNPLYGTKFESESTSRSIKNSDENCLHISNPNSNSISNFSHAAQSPLDKPLKCTTNEALDTNSPKICSTILLKSSTIHDSLNMTPLYKSAITTPTCKSPDPIKEETLKSIIQKESRYHSNKVEIAQEQKLIQKNKKFEELHIKNFDKNNKRFENENDTTKEVVQRMNLNKECCKEKTTSNCNPKVSSCKSISKCQIILWPMQIIFRILMYPLKLVLKLIFFFFYLFKVFWRGVFKFFIKLKNFVMMGVGNVRSKILGIFQNKCNNTQGHFGCRCASKTYILVVLSSLLLPNLFDLDFYLVNRFIDGKIVIREVLNFDYTKDHPSATVNLLPQQIMGKAKGYFPDKEVMTAHAFPPSYIFHMIVHLTLPESKYNQEIGMFQISIETFSARGHSLNKASRASMLRYYSSPIKYMRSVIMGIPIVLGLCQESQILSIQMMKSQKENEHSPTASINVEIEPKIGHSTALGVPEIYHAELQVIAHNPYLREIARNWVWNLYVYSGLALFIFEVLLVLCCCQKIFPRKVSNKRKNEGFVSKSKKMTFEQGQKFAQAPRRLHRGHIYYSKNLPLALPNISNIHECRNITCSEASLEEFKMIKLDNDSIPKTSCNLSF